MPLIRTILTTVSILALLNFWNDIVWPMLVIDRDALASFRKIARDTMAAERDRDNE